jgi:hypothetical protein
MSIESRPTIYRLASRFTALIVAGVALSGCSDKGDSLGGVCEPFRVYAQNRWEPLGTAVREEPDVLSKKIDPGFAPNEVIAVDGWIETGEPVYPTNTPPWDSDIWFHLANREGWVSFAGVRGTTTSPDPGGMSGEGGQPAPTTPECEGTYQP